VVRDAADWASWEDWFGDGSWALKMDPRRGSWSEAEDVGGGLFESGFQSGCDRKEDEGGAHSPVSDLPTRSFEDFGSLSEKERGEMGDNGGKEGRVGEWAEKDERFLRGKSKGPPVGEALCKRPLVGRGGGTGLTWK
jgi:hypothetical protein